MRWNQHFALIAAWHHFSLILSATTTTAFAFGRNAFVSRPLERCSFSSSTYSSSSSSASSTEWLSLRRRFSSRPPQASSSSSSSSAAQRQLQQKQQQLQQQQQQRRQTLLSRRGLYFNLDRLRGTVEFGSTLDLVTTLSAEVPNFSQIAAWLRDERGLALSIWDESLITELGNSIYRLQLMTLQFVTLQLSPTVDVKMWTTELPTTTPPLLSVPNNIDSSNNATTTSTTKTTSVPVFTLQSVGFDPHLQLLPGIGISAEMLGIDIVVVGEMRPTPNGRGVQGRISFATTGNLPPPLRILPEPILQGAANSISETVAQFAVRSFQKGAIQQYRQFCRKQQQQKQKQQ